MKARGSDELFSLDPSDRMHGKGSSCIKKVRKDIGKMHFFTERMVKDLNRLPREVINITLDLSLFKRHLDNALHNML